MLSLNHDCCCSVTKLCPTLCNPMDWSTPGFPVLHYLQVCSDSCPLSWWCHPTISSSLASLILLPSIFPSIRVFSLMRWLFTSGGRSIGASASASAFPVNIQGWFPLGLPGLISLQSKQQLEKVKYAPLISYIGCLLLLPHDFHMPIASHHGTPEAFSIFHYKSFPLLHLPFESLPNTSDGGWLPCCKLWIKILCLSLFRWSYWFKP